MTTEHTQGGHTPGPWEWDVFADGWALVGPPKPGSSVRQAVDVSAEENRPIVAAAPDLLGALKAVQPFFEGEHAYDHPHCVLMRNAISKAETLARTTGGE